jgi:hypothetical protein
MSRLVIRRISGGVLHLLSMEFLEVVNIGGDRLLPYLLHYTKNMTALGTTDSDSFGRNP